MPGDTGGDPRYKERVTSHREWRAKRAETGVETVTLDGAGNPYGDTEGEPVEKGETDDRDPSLDTDDITADLRAQAESSRPECLSKEALAKGVGERPERELPAETIMQSLHDTGLSTTEAVLEVRDELRDLRAEGSLSSTGGRVSKAGDRDAETDADPDAETEAGDHQDESPPTVPRLADDDPVPDTVDELVKCDPGLADDIGIPVDSEGNIPDGRRGFARHRYALAKAKARSAV